MRSMRVMRPRRERLYKSIGALIIRCAKSQPSVGCTATVPHGETAEAAGRHPGWSDQTGRMRGWPTRAGFVMQAFVAVDLLSVRAMCQPLAGAPFGSARS